MAIKPFLAMTAAEFHAAPSLPEKVAWMACHFSPYGRGLSNLPEFLPANSLLILNDRIPVLGHDPEQICQQLTTTLSNHHCHSLLLDFQRPNCEDTAKIVRYLWEALGLPVAVSEAYASQTSGPVFLPPLPHHIPLEEYIAPWKEREIWLELALDGEKLTLTENNFAVMPFSSPKFPEGSHAEKALHCHYHVELKETEAEFTFWRTTEDLDSLMEEAQLLGIRNVVGLYQEFFI
jgi:hypothetical protein